MVIDMISILTYHRNWLDMLAWWRTMGQLVDTLAHHQSSSTDIAKMSKWFIGPSGAPWNSCQPALERGLSRLAGWQLPPMGTPAGLQRPPGGWTTASGFGAAVALQKLGTGHPDVGSGEKWMVVDNVGSVLVSLGRTKMGLVVTVVYY